MYHFYGILLQNNFLFGQHKQYQLSIIYYFPAIKSRITRMMERYRQIGKLFQSQLSQGFLMQPDLACFRRQSQPNYNTIQQQNSFQQQVHDNCYKLEQKASNNISWSVSKLSHSQQPSLIKSSHIQHIDKYTNPGNNQNSQILFSQASRLQYISEQQMQYYLIQLLGSICQHKMESVIAQFNNIRNQLVFAIQKEQEKREYCRMGRSIDGSVGVQGIDERSGRSLFNNKWHKYGLKNQIQVLIAEILQHLGYIRPQLQKNHDSQQINSSNIPKSAQIYIRQKQIPEEYYHNKISQLIKQAKTNYYYNNQLESSELYNHVNVFGEGLKLQCQGYCWQNDVLVGNQRERLENEVQDGEITDIDKTIEQKNNIVYTNRQIATNINQTQQQKSSLTYSKFSNKSSVNKLADQHQENQYIHSNVFNSKNCNKNKEEPYKFEDMELHFSISQTDINSNSKSKSQSQSQFQSNQQLLSNQDTILYDKTAMGHCRYNVDGNVRDQYLVGFKQNKLGFENWQYLYGQAPLNKISIRQNTPRNTYNYLKYRMKLKRNLQKQFNELDKNKVGNNKNRVDKDVRQDKIRIKEELKRQKFQYKSLDQQITIFKPNRIRDRNKGYNKQRSSKNKQKPQIEFILNERIDYRNQVKIANQSQSKQQAQIKIKTKMRKQKQKQKCKQRNRGYPFSALIHHRVHI